MEAEELYLPTTLPKRENLQYFYNESNKNYDIIDLSTGKTVSTEKFELSSTAYTLALGDYICDLVHQGKTLAAISRMEGMPSITRIRAWIAIFPEFKARIQVARKERAETFADMALDLAMSITNKDDVPAAKTAIDTLKWRAERADPDQYGARKESNGPSTTAINITLHTGVLDAQAPKDIVVDEFGNFKGFDGDPMLEEVLTESKIEVELNRERFQETEYGEEDERCGEGESTP